MGDVSGSDMRVMRMNELLGSWSLVEWREVSADGQVRHPWGRDCFGEITYLANGRMSAILMRPERALVGMDLAELKTLSTAVGSPSQWGRIAAAVSPFARYVKAAMGYFSYGGRYRLETEPHQIVHEVEYSLIPDLVGTEQLRPYTRSGVDEFTLHEPLGEWAQAFTWRRVA